MSGKPLMIALCLCAMFLSGVVTLLWLHHSTSMNRLIVMQEHIDSMEEDIAKLSVVCLLQDQNQHTMMQNIYQLFDDMELQIKGDVDQIFCLYKVESEKYIQTILKFQFPKVYDIEDVCMCSVSAYTNSVAECDSTPNITADGSKVKRGYVALSQDLIAKWGGKDIFGREVVVLGQGVFEVRDTMNERYRNSADIFFFDKKYADKFGRKHGVAVILLKG